MHIWVGPQHREQQPWFLTGGYSPALFASLLARGTAVPALVRMPLAYLWHGGCAVHAQRLPGMCGASCRPAAHCSAAWCTAAAAATHGQYARVQVPHTRGRTAAGVSRVRRAPARQRSEGPGQPARLPHRPVTSSNGQTLTSFLFLSWRNPVGALHRAPQGTKCSPTWPAGPPATAAPRRRACPTTTTGWGSTSRCCPPRCARSLVRGAAAGLQRCSRASSTSRVLLAALLTALQRAPADNQCPPLSQRPLPFPDVLHPDCCSRVEVLLRNAASRTGGYDLAL